MWVPTGQRVSILFGCRHHVVLQIGALGMHIGIDLDNTLIDYDQVFGSAGAELGILPEHMIAASKSRVRNYLCAEEDGNHTWMRLQGQVYGRFIDNAVFKPGAEEALKFLQENSFTVSIVSHKTERGHFDEHGINLRDAARRWLEARLPLASGESGLAMERIYFSPTRNEKVEQIDRIGCSVFIDDLPEVFEEPGFPAGVRKILYADNEGIGLRRDGIEAIGSWQEIVSRVFRPLCG